MRTGAFDQSGGHDDLPGHGKSNNPLDLEREHGFGQQIDHTFITETNIIDDFHALQDTGYLVTLAYVAEILGDRASEMRSPSSTNSEWTMNTSARKCATEIC